MQLELPKQELSHHDARKELFVILAFVAGNNQFNGNVAEEKDHPYGHDLWDEVLMHSCMYNATYHKEKLCL